MSLYGLVGPEEIQISSPTIEMPSIDFRNVAEKNNSIPPFLPTGFSCSDPFLGCSRDIKDTTVGTLSQRITNQVHGLKGLNSKLLDIRSYLEKVAMGKLPINHQIIYQLQDVFNLLPDVNLQEFVKAFYLKTNDQMVVVYLASLIRSVVALHNLINNKIANRDAEKKEGQEKEESKKERKDEKDKDKEKSDGKKEEKKEKK